MKILRGISPVMVRKLLILDILKNQGGGGLAPSPLFTHGLRRGLHSDAASRLTRQ
jgi:hypothetical protein